MNGNVAVVGSFIGACAIITWRDVKNPDQSWPLPAPPPYRYIGAGVAFGLLGMVGAFFNERIAGVLAIGLLVGLGFQTASQTTGASGFWNDIKTGGGVLNQGGTAEGSGGLGSSVGKPISSTTKA